MSDKVVPRKLNQQRVEQEAERAKSSGDKFNWVKFKEGDSFLHVLPPTANAKSDDPFFEVNVHFLTNPEGKQFPFKCAKGMEESCVICDSAARLLGSVDELTQSRGKSIKARNAKLYNVVTFDKKTGETKLGILSAGAMVHREIMKELRCDMEEGLDPVSYSKGLLIRVTRVGTTQFNTKYSARSERQRFNIADMEDDYVNLPNLEEIYEDFSNAELAQVLEGNFDPKGKFPKEQVANRERVNSRLVTDDEEASEVPQTSKPKTNSRLVADPVEAEEDEAVNEAVASKNKTSVSNAKSVLGL